ncbi:MAG: four-carbon acid sugar kinase family protein [Betaproteobacteria bacterium]
MLIGCIADDFTGAADLVNTLSRGGLSTVQSVGVPEGAPPADCDGVVVALKTRSCDAQEAVAQSLAALAWLKRAGARQFLFKVCSTFDSTPRGNIGPVAEALRLALLSPHHNPPPQAGEGEDCLPCEAGEAWGGGVVPWPKPACDTMHRALPQAVKGERGGVCVPVCPAYPSYRRTIYRGHLFVGDALLSESGMQNHPLTPMTDPNLVRVLQAQTRERVGLVPLEDVRRGPDAIAARLWELGRAGQGFAIVDCAEDEDLRRLALGAVEVPLWVGGSGLGLGLPENFRRAGLLRAPLAAPARIAAPLVVLAGSCSTATRGQVAAYAASHPTLYVDAKRALVETGYVDEVAAWCLAQHVAPLVASSAEPDAVAANARQLGAGVAAGIEHFFARLAQALAARGVRRFVVAGGETSGAVVDALGLRWLAFGAEIDPGAPSMFGSDPQGEFALALKSGNFGAPDFFTKAQDFL